MSFSNDIQLKRSAPFILFAFTVAFCGVYVALKGGSISNKEFWVLLLIASVCTIAAFRFFPRPKWLPTDETRWVVVWKDTYGDVYAEEKRFTDENDPNNNKWVRTYDWKHNGHAACRLYYLTTKKRLETFGTSPDISGEKLALTAEKTWLEIKPDLPA